MLVRDKKSSALFMPLSSAIVIKRKKEKLYVPLVCRNGLIVKALVDARASVSAIFENESNRIKQQAPTNIFKINDSSRFSIQVADCELEN